MTTPFTNYGPVSPRDPAGNSFLVTPSDTDLLPHVIRAFYVDAAVDTTPVTVKFACRDGSTDTITVYPGTGQPLMTNQIFSTGTSATGIHGYY